MQVSIGIMQLSRSTSLDHDTIAIIFEQNRTEHTCLYTWYYHLYFKLNNCIPKLTIYIIIYWTEKLLGFRIKINVGIVLYLFTQYTLAHHVSVTYCIWWKNKKLMHLYIFSSFCFCILNRSNPFLHILAFFLKYCLQYILNNGTSILNARHISSSLFYWPLMKFAVALYSNWC